MFKKQTFVLLCTIALTAIPSLSLAAFSDVPSTHPQFKSIEALQDQNIIKGYSDGTFKPDQSISRSEFLKILFNDIGYKPAEKTYKTTFNDVPEGSWFAPFVQKAIDLNVAYAGSKDGFFFPSRAITKLDAIKMAFQVEGIATPYSDQIDKNDLFDDVKPTANYAYIAKAAKENGVIAVESPELFKPFKTLTRGDAAELIYDIEKARTNGGVITINSQSSSTDTSSVDEQTAQLLNNPKFSILVDVWKKANSEYYYQNNFTQDDLVYGAIEGLVQKLGDKYTTFQEPLGAAELTQFLQGEFEGIGTVLDTVNDQIVVVEPLHDSPAEKAGIKAGDIITQIDGKSIKDFTLENVISLIKGPAGTTVELTIDRQGQQLDFSIVRDKITIKGVSGKMMGSIGYIQIEQFFSDSAEDFDKTLADLMSASPSGFIIDLRGNPGGYVETATNILNHFVPAGKAMVSTKSVENIISEVDSAGPGELAHYPIAVLVDQDTASAAEIMAAALQDLGIAKLVGTTTFGKGSVQEVIHYDDNSILKMSIAHWLSPLGKDINGIGLTPDIQVDRTPKDIENGYDPQLDAALNYIKNAH